MDDLVHKSNLILTLASDRQWAPENENHYKTLGLKMIHKKYILNLDKNKINIHCLEGLGRLNDVGGANDFRHANKTHCSAHTAASVSLNWFQEILHAKIKFHRYNDTYET